MPYTVACSSCGTTLHNPDPDNAIGPCFTCPTCGTPVKPLSSSLRSQKYLISSPKSPTSIPDLPPELAGHPQYEILRELGRGGMGVVYLVKNKLMDRLEVLKVVNKSLLDRSSAVERFLREIRSAARLSHANVVGAYSAVQVGDLLAFAMEYVEGEDLAAVVDAHGPLPIAHACYYVRQAALGLQHAFEKGMVHRDIKPQNLILSRLGKGHLVKILDFGLAKVTREKTEETGLTGAGKMMGTPDYMAPEQMTDAASADIRADIYSLGCTLYYLLTGAPPFAGKSLYAVMNAHQSLEARPLNLVRPEVSESLSAVVAKMMAKEPAQRYQTPIEVVRALDPIVKGVLKPLPSKPVPPRGGQPDTAPPTVICETANEGNVTIVKDALESLPPKAAESQGRQRGAATQSLLLQDTMIVGRATVVRAMKTAGATRLAVSLAVVLLLAGLAGLCAVIVLRRKTPEGIRPTAGGYEVPATIPTKEERQPRPLVRPSETPARTVYLADLKEMNVSAFAFVKKSGKVKGVASPNGLALHPPDKGSAHVVFKIAKQYGRFKATVGIGDGTNSGRGSDSPLTFSVVGDGKILWKSTPIQQCGQARDCDVSIDLVDLLELRVHCPGRNYCAHAIWVEPRVEQSARTVAAAEEDKAALRPAGQAAPNAVNEAREKVANEIAKRRQEEAARAEEATRKQEAKITESIAHHRAALKAPDAETRIQAAVGLGRIGPKASAAVPDLDKALEDRDQGVGKAAAVALVKIGKAAVPALIETLANGTQRSRMNAAYALALPDRDAKETVPAPDATVRKLKELFREVDEAALLVAVMEALTIVGGLDRSMIDPLTSKGLRHADASVRSKALDSLRHMGLDTLRIKTLAELNLGDASSEIRNRAGRLLGERLGQLSDADMKDVRALLGMTNKPQAVHIGLAAVKRGGKKAKEALPELLKLLLAAEGKDKLELVLLLADIDAKDSRVAEAISPILVAALRPQTKDDQPSEVVLKAIAKIGQPAVDEIFKALKAADGRGIINANNRKALFLAMQRLGREAYSESNVRLLHDYQKKEQYHDVQEAAGKAIQAMLPP